MGILDRVGAGQWLGGRGGILSRLSTPAGGAEMERIYLGGIRYASQTGYVVPGWRLENYIRTAVYGGVDIVSGARIPPGFECVVIWGKAGTGKSNLARQLLYRSLYGDWEKVVNYTITSVEEFLAVVEERERGVDVPAIILDDISRTLSRQLWQENRTLYSAFYKSLQVIRSLFPVILVTVPSLTYIPEMLAPIMSFEAHVTPRHRYFVNRIVPSVDYYRIQSYVTKVLVEVGSFKLSAEPRPSFEMYRMKRERLALDAVGELAKAMEDTRLKKKQEEEKTLRTAERLEKRRREEKLHIALTCTNCRFVWNYRPRSGTYKPEVFCPRCREKVRVPPQFLQAIAMENGGIR